MRAVMELASKVQGPEPLEIMRKAGLEGRIEKFQASQALRPHMHSLSGTVEHAPADRAPPMAAGATSTTAAATGASEPLYSGKAHSIAEPRTAHPLTQTPPMPLPPQAQPQAPPPLNSALALRKHPDRRDRSLSPRQLSSERSSTPASTDGVEAGAPPTPRTEASYLSGHSATATPTPVSLSAPAVDAPADRSPSATPVPPDCSPSPSPLSLRPPPTGSSAGGGLGALPGTGPKVEARANGRAALAPSIHRSALVPLLGTTEANGGVRPLSATPIVARLSPPANAKEELSAKEDLRVEVLSSNSSVRRGHYSFVYM